MNPYIKSLCLNILACLPISTLSGMITTIMIHKISSKISTLRSLSKIVPTCTLKPIYNAITQPHVNQGDAIDDSAYKTRKTRHQKLQTRDVRLITGSRPCTSKNLMFYVLKWQSLQQRCDFQKSSLVYKCRMGLAPQYLCDMFTANNSNHSYNMYNTRNPTQDRAAYYHCRFPVIGLNLQNNLPNNIKESTSLSTFKGLITTTWKLYTITKSHFAR